MLSCIYVHIYVYMYLEILKVHDLKIYNRNIYYEPCFRSEATCQPCYRCLLLYYGLMGKKCFLGLMGLWMQYSGWPLGGKKNRLAAILLAWYPLL